MKVPFKLFIHAVSQASLRYAGGIKMTEKFYLEDILSQDTQMQNALSCYRTGGVKEKLEKLAGMSITKVIFSGMGSSHFCAYGAGILLQQHGICAQVVSTGELIYYERECIDKNTVLCLISQSGESAEIKHLLELVGEDMFVIAVTNKEESTLGKRGNLTFALQVSDEISVTTRTYQSSLIMAQLIAAAICGEKPEAVLKEYEKTVSYMADYLKDYEEESNRLRDFCGNMKTVSLIGRGNAMSSVRAGALFLREVAKFPAIDFDSAEFRHGPMEMVQEDFYAIVFAPSGKTQELNIGLAKDIGEKGGKVFLITDEKGIREWRGENPNILPVGLRETEEYASPLLQILPVQLLANVLAEEKGIPAGVFRWGSKITSVE